MSNRCAINTRHHTIFRINHTIFIRLFPPLTLRWLRFLPALRRLLRSAQPMHAYTRTQPLRVHTQQRRRAPLAIAPNGPGRFHSHPALRIAF